MSTNERARQRLGPARRPVLHAGRLPSRAAFTLVELLVVVLIIGVLAAVAVPQFGDSSADAKLAALDQNLASVRSAIDLYHYQHGDVYPGMVKTHRATAAGPAAPHASAADAFVKQLTLYSDASGNTCAEKHSSFPFGPYLRKSLPENPLPADGCSSPAGVTVTTDDGALSADANPSTGWKASSTTGEFIANNSDHSSR